MSNMKTCERCGNMFITIYRDECSCRPFTIVHPDVSDDPITVHAHDIEDAAEKYAQEFNECNDEAMANKPIDITIDGRPLRVHAEAVWEYWVGGRDD